MNKLMGTIIVSQVLVFAMGLFNDRNLTEALEEAATKGHHTFKATQICDLFRSTQSSFTMVNGWQSLTVPNKCSVNLVNSDSGVAVEASTNLLFDIHPPVRRFVIEDCSKLSKQIYDLHFLP